MIGILYHNADLDGISAAGLLRRYYPDAELYGWDYADGELPNIKGKMLFIVDLSLNANQLTKLYDQNEQIVWIDHHKTSEEVLESISAQRFNAIISTAHAAVWLVYNFLDGGIEVPEAINLLERYDRWDKKKDWFTRVLPFQYYARTKIKTPDDFRYPENIDVEDWIDKGKLMLASILQLYEREIQYASEIEFHGYSALVLNTQAFNSLAFEQHPKKSEYDLFISYAIRGDKLRVGLYSEKIDVADLAKKYGGGGHKGAAGFVLCSADAINFISYMLAHSK